jgi:DNA-binding GntR family transcriptional regulator
MPIGPRTPQYALVAQRLMSAIREGRYRSGSLLPTENALCRQFDVSRITIRSALRQLEMRGLVSRRAGVGTRVEMNRQPERFVHSVDGLEAIAQLVVGLSFRVEDAQTVHADAALSAVLECREGQEFMRVSGLRIDASGRPLCASVHYIANAYAVPVDKLNGRTGLIAEYLAQQAGEEIEEARQIIQARTLGAADARRLKAKPRQAALATRRWYYTPAGRLLMVTESLFPEDRYSYSVRLRRERLSG